MNIIVLRQVERQFKKIPKDVLVDAYALFDDLACGKTYEYNEENSITNDGKFIPKIF